MTFGFQCRIFIVVMFVVAPFKKIQGYIKEFILHFFLILALFEVSGPNEAVTHQMAVPVPSISCCVS
jgi:hypothetical protein